jgi:threonine synthase
MQNVNEFIAAMNINHVLGDYLKTGEFHSQPSQQTYANAMDVGNPSNFERLLQLYTQHPHQMAQEIKGESITDPEILTEIKKTYEMTGVILDPHTAVGVAAARKHDQDQRPMIITATAHPAKFPEVIKTAINNDVKLPEQLQKLMHLPKHSHPITTDYQMLHAILSDA